MVAIVNGLGLGLYNSALKPLNGSSLGQGRPGEQIYVNTHTGNLVLQSQDEFLSGTGADLRHLRTYNSLGTLNDGDADQWRWQGERRVTLTGTLNSSGSTVALVGGDGYETIYAWTGSVYRATAGDGAHDTLTWNSGTSEWVRTEGSSAVTETFDGTSGWIKTLRDTSGNGFDYTFSSDKLTKIVDLNSGQTFELVYGGNGKLSRLDTRTTATGSLTGQVYYNYDGSGRLTSVVTDLTPSDNSITDSNVFTTTYTYDSTSLRIASISQSDGIQAAFTYELVGSDYRIKTVTDQNGVSTFTFDTTNRRTDVEVTNGLSDSWSYYHDTQGRLTRVESTAVGGVRQDADYAYDSSGNVTSVTDGRGNVINYTCDANGNRTQEKDSLGNTIDRTYDSSNRLVTETRYAVPHTTTPSSPETARFVYDTAGRLRYSISAQGRVSEQRYSSQGLVTASIQYAGAVYDVSSLATTATLSLSQLDTWVTSQDKTNTQLTEFSYDYRGNVSQKRAFSTVNSSGVGTADDTDTITHYTYSEHGQLLQTLISANSGTPTLASYVYDGAGRQTSAVDQTGTTTTSYGTNTITVSNSATVTVVTTLDNYGRILSIASSGDSLTRTTQYVYDGGLLRMTQLPTGERGFIFYDAAGRVSFKVDALGFVVGHTYDADGHLTQEIRYKNAADTTGWYNGTAVVKHSLTVGTSGTDLITHSDDRTTTNTYDNAGRLTQTVQAIGAALVTSYDGASRISQTTHDGVITRYFHDKDGLLIGTLDAERFFSEHSYDAVGRLTQTVRYITQVSTTLQSSGTFASIKSAVGSGATLKSCYYYDAQGRQIGRVNEQGFLQETVYDAEHLYRDEKQYLKAITVGSGDTLADLKTQALASGGVVDTTRFEFDAFGRLSKKTAADGTLTEYQYDSAGRLVQMIEAAGTADERITRTRYNAFSDVTGSVTVAGADIENYAWTKSGDSLVQTAANAGISLAAGSALFNDTTPSEVKATIYKSDGTLYDTVYTTVGATETPTINIQTEAPDQPYGYQTTATTDTTTTGTQAFTLTVDSTQQYATLTQTSNVQNFGYTYNSSNQTIQTNGSGFSLGTNSATHNDDTPTSVEAKVYTSGGTLVQTITLIPGHVTQHTFHDAYGGTLNYKVWHGASNWNGHVNLGSLAPGNYYVDITTKDEAILSQMGTNLYPGSDGDNTWTRTNTVNFTIGGQAPDHIDTRLSWPLNLTPAETASVTFRYRISGSSGSWTTLTVGSDASTRYVDIDHAANGTYEYEIVYKDAYDNVLKTTNTTTRPTFTVNNTTDSTPGADFQYPVYLATDQVPASLTVDSAQQHTTGYTTTSNVNDYGWAYNKDTGKIQSSGDGYSLVTNSAAHTDDTPTSVEAKVYTSGGTLVQTITLFPGHSTEDHVPGAYGGPDIEYEIWNPASNWNGEVNLGDLNAGNYYAVITVRDDATSGNTVNEPGRDNDSIWTQTNTVYFTIGGQAADHIDTRLSWSEALTPAGTSSVTFRYRTAGSSNEWILKTVQSNDVTRYVNIDHAANGTYEYEIVYLNAAGNVLNTTNTTTRPTFTINGTTDSTSAMSLKLAGSSVTAFPMTTSEAATIERIEVKVFAYGTTTPQIGTTAITYPAAHANFVVNGECQVNISVGSVLPDGKYDVQIKKFYKSHADSTSTHTLEVGLQVGPTTQNRMWNAVDNWNGQVNLKVGTGGLPADTYRIEISVRDEAANYSYFGSTQLGTTSGPGADGDGTWTRVNNVYTTIGTPAASTWNSAIDRYGVRYELDGAGRRIAELGPDGQQTLLYYDKNGRIAYTVKVLSSTRGEVTAITYNAFGEVANTTRYSAPITDTSGLTGGAITTTLTTRISAIANSANDSTVSHTYNKDGTLATSVDAEAFTTTYGYNSRGQRVDELRTISSGVTVNTHFDLDLLGRTISTHFDSAGSLGVSTEYAYDGFGRITQLQEPLGQTDYTYALNGREITLTDAVGRTTKTEYDAYGRVLKTYDGLNQVTTYAYDTANRLITVTTPDSVTFKTWKTRTGETLKVQVGNGGVTEYDYTMDGKLATVRDATGAVITANSYDNSGRLLETADGNGSVIHYTYDAANRVVERAVDPAGLNQCTGYTFDGQGRQLTVTQGLGSSAETATQYSYDRKGQLKQIIIDPAGLQLSTRFTYDGLGNTKTVEQGTVALPAQQVTQYTYDKLGRKTQEQRDPAGLNITTQYKYDAGGNLTRVINANGHSTWYGYDDAGKLLREIDALGNVTGYYYDVNGRLSETRRFFNTVSTGGLGDTATGVTDPTTDVKDAVSHYVYDSRNRQRYTLSAVDGSNWMVNEKLYDSNGNVIETRLYDQHLANSSVSTRMGSGSDGGTRITEAEMASELAALGYSSSFGNTQRTFYAYDANNRLRFTVNAKGEVSENVYDAAGNITAQTRFATVPTISGAYTVVNINSAVNRSHADNQTTQFVYSKAGRLVQNIDALGKSEYFTYDALGNKTAFTNKNGAVWNYLYDKANRLTAEITPAVDVLYSTNTNAEFRRLRTNFTYDAMGNVTSRTEGTILLNESGSSVDSAAARITAYEYDALGRQTKTTMPGYYDPATGRMEKTTGTGRFQLTSEVKYDALGNAVRNKIRVANNGTASDFIYQYKTYDALGRLAHDIDALNYVTTNIYESLAVQKVRRSAAALTATVPGSGYWTAADVTQNLTVSSTNDRTITTTYDRAGRKTEVSQEQVGGNYASSESATSNSTSITAYTAAARTRFYYNALGQLTAEEAKVNTSDWARTYHFYDKLNRETATVDALGYVTTSGYDAVGNLTQTVEYATAITVTGALTNPVLPSTSTVYNDRTTNNSYDKLNRLTSVSKTSVYLDGTTLSSQLKTVLASTYDNVGNAITQTINGVTTKTAYDALGRVTHVTEPQRAAVAASVIDPFNTGGTVTLSPVTDYILDALGNAVRIERSATGAKGGDTITVYQKFDHLGSLLEATDGLSGPRVRAGIARYEYDVTGNVTKEYLVGDDRPNTSLTENRYYYDLTGRELARTSVVTDSAGVKQQSGKSVDYNAFGEIVNEYQAWGTASVTTFSGLTRAIRQSHTLDTMGRVASTQAQSGATVYYYDLLGHATRVEQQGNGSGSDGTNTRITETFYDLLGRAKAQRLPAYTGIATSMGTTTSTLNPKLIQSFDRWGNVETFTDPAGNITAHIYNHNNQVIRETLPVTEVRKEDGTAYSPTLIHEIYYNDLGLAVQEVDRVSGGAQLRSRSNQYNAIGQLTAAIDATNIRTDYLYDALGNQVASKNGLGFVYVNSYNSRGDQIERALLRKSDGSAYTGTGTPVKVILNTYDYDAARRRVVERNYISTQADGTTNMSVQVTKRSFYNELGLITWSSNESGIIMTYKYDLHGNKIEERNAINHVSQWSYSYNTSNYTFGRMASSVDIGGILTTYSYNDFGQMTQKIQDSSLDQYYNYAYHENGLLKSVTQGALSSTMRVDSFDYDIRGNRVREVRSVLAYSFTQLMAYDARNRLAQAKLVDGGITNSNDMGYMDLKYEFDEFGNRRHVDVTYQKPGSGTNHDKDLWYAYDKEGRMLIEEGIVTAGGIDIGSSQGIEMTYDAAGQRVTETYFNSIGGGAAIFNTLYAYNDLGLVRSKLKEGYLNQTLMTTNLSEFKYTLRGFKIEEKKYENGDLEETINSSYEQDGRLSSQVTYDDDNDLKNRVFYYTYDSDSNSLNGYDKAGNLQKYTYISYDDGLPEYENIYDYDYVITAAGEYRYNEIDVDSDLANYETGETDISYDMFGNAYDIVVNNGRNAQGQVEHTYKDFYFNTDGQIVFSVEDSPGTFHDNKNSYLYANGQTVGLISDTWQTNFAPLDAGRAGLKQAPTPSQYIVQGGESLEDISQAVFGNSRFWYLIADANGLTYAAGAAIPSEDAGRALRIPNIVSNKFNDAGTFKPYNPAEIIGDITPSPVAPPPPKEQSNTLVAIIAAVVAVVVTIATQGALGKEAWAWAIGAMAGNAAGQVVSIVGGNQEKFDGDSFRTAGIGGFIGGAIAGVGATTAAQVGYAALGNYVAQRISVELGYQKEFSWASVATAAISAGVMEGTGDEVLASFTSAVVGARLHAIETDQRTDWAGAALNAFGQIVGNGIVKALSEPPPKPLSSWDADVEYAKNNRDVLVDHEARMSITPQEYANRRAAALHRSVAAQNASESNAPVTPVAALDPVEEKPQSRTGRSVVFKPEETGPVGSLVDVSGTLLGSDPILETFQDPLVINTETGASMLSRIGSGINDYVINPLVQPLALALDGIQAAAVMGATLVTGDYYRIYPFSNAGYLANNGGSRSDIMRQSLSYDPLNQISTGVQDTAVGVYSGDLNATLNGITEIGFGGLGVYGSVRFPVGGSPGAMASVLNRSTTTVPARVFTNLHPEDVPRVPNIIPNEKLLTMSQKNLAYVVKEDGTLVVGRNNVNQGHIDLAAGQPVLAAGELRVHAGTIKYIDNYSGHYRPSGIDAQRAAENAFRKIGFDVEGKYIERLFE